MGINWFYMGYDWIYFGVLGYEIGLYWDDIWRGKVKEFDYIGRIFNLKVLYFDFKLKYYSFHRSLNQVLVVHCIDDAQGPQVFDWNYGVKIKHLWFI